MMMKSKLDKNYWEDRYSNDKTGWNIGYISSPIKAYIDQLEDKTKKILIPGAGNSFEAEYLWNLGFKNVFIIDIAQQPLLNFKNRVDSFPENQLIQKDFFDLDDSFDLIIEQTFFCAIDPILRTKYVDHMYQSLRSEGKLVGLLFDFELTESGPPFGGSLTEYEARFKNAFKIRTLEKSYNSIKERQGKELFFIFEKKTQWH
jgi:thiopurine S-methyltransferase